MVSDEEFSFLNPPAGMLAHVDQIEARFEGLLVELLAAQEMASIATGAGDEQETLNWVMASRVKLATVLEDPDDVVAFIAFTVSRLSDALDKIDELELITNPPDFIDGTGQKLFKVHSEDRCVGSFCVIHNPCPGPWSNWITHWRGDGPMDIWHGFERICPHGKGHPAVEEIMRGNFQEGGHACCVCPCSEGDCDTVFGLDNVIVGYEVRK